MPVLTQPPPSTAPAPLAPQPTVPVTPTADIKTRSYWGDQIAFVVWLSCASVLAFLLLKDLLWALLH